jgi:hypothetical protein
MTEILVENWKRYRLRNNSGWDGILTTLAPFPHCPAWEKELYRWYLNKSGRKRAGRG